MSKDEHSQDVTTLLCTDVRPEVETNSSPSEHNPDPVNGSPSTCNSDKGVKSLALGYVRLINPAGTGQVQCELQVFGCEECTPAFRKALLDIPLFFVAAGSNPLLSPLNDLKRPESVLAVERRRTRPYSKAILPDLLASLLLLEIARLESFHAVRHRPCPGGSVFSSPKIITGAGNNPFAVRSSPGRVNNENSGDTVNNSSASIIAPSKFGATASSPCNSSNSVQAVGFSASSSTSHSLKESHDASECNGSSKPLLRPSLIGTGNSFTSSGNSQNHSILKPATLGNPFSRAVDFSVEESPTAQQPGPRRDSGTDATETKPTLLIPSRLNNVSAVGASSNARAGEGSDEASELATIPATLSDAAAAESVIPSAVPRPSLTSGSLFSTTVTSVPSVANPAPPTPTACANFVFGQKLHERVANPNHTSTEPTSNGAESNANLFTVIPKEKTESETASTNGIAASKTLSDSARELEEARAAKRKYDEVTVVTGEEDEQNALQVYGKLFTFDKVQGTWIERGRGTLRLNDKQLDNHALQSRLVMRTQGCLRVILNTKIWAEMTIDKTSSKSIRMTAVDGDQIRVFLLMASLKDTETLFNALEWRLATLRAHQSRAATAAAAASSIPDSATAYPAVPHNEDGTSSPKRRALSVEEELGDETKKKRSE